ncbi:hypothetical protein CONLIGDRAFT_494331 [Coniochaeta ligniaria NRRL 30616]|uniref:Uncharacterized protein n=1 Tax=Coniochaeta ligniaria NRRL 30616 TaxID=1408157 RepID=A0A1J7JB63_9PEZI|nr:hypothetical protein CONLIGDRAFT_494331 [Coniochaeta ligniaria NRRL 30616]
MASTSRAAEEDWDLVLASGSEPAINLVEFKPHAWDSDAASDAGSDKEPADVTTALIGSTGRELGAPEVRRRFWWSRVKASDPDAIATQPSVYDDVDCP